MYANKILDSVLKSTYEHIFSMQSFIIVMLYDNLVNNLTLS